MIPLQIIQLTGKTHTFAVKLFGTTHQQYPLQLWGGDTLQLLLPLVLFLRCFQPRDDDHVGGALGLEAVGGLELLRLALSRSSPPKYRHGEYLTVSTCARTVVS